MLIVMAIGRAEREARCALRYSVLMAWLSAGQSARLGAPSDSVLVALGRAEHETRYALNAIVHGR